MDIFIDIDGVLANFEKHLLDIHGIKLVGRSNNLPWDKLDFDFFSTIPLFDGAKEFYNILSNDYNANLLSSPILNPGCYSGKAQWILTNLASNKFELKKLILCPSEKKHLLSGKNRILIDDYGKNIEGWILSGGIGIHVLETPTKETFSEIVDYLKINNLKKVQNKLFSVDFKD